MADGLTPKQRVFVDEYLLDLNATQAAERAGYRHPNKQGPRLLVNVGIKAEVEQRLNDRAMPSVEVLTRLTEQARGDMSDFVTIKRGLPFIDLEKAEQRGKLHLLKKFKNTDKGIEIELYDAQSALVHLGRYHKLFVDRVQQDDWRSEAIELIRKGEVAYSALEEEFGSDLASQLFASAGVPLSHGTGEAQEQSRNSST